MNQSQKDRQDILNERKELAAVVQKDSLLDTFAAITKPANVQLAERLDTAEEVDTRHAILSQAARDNGYRDIHDLLECKNGLAGETIDMAMERYGLHILRQVKA